MINLAVISLKDIIRFFRNIIIIVITLIFIFKVIGVFKNKNYNTLEELKKNSFTKSSFTSILEKTILVSNSFKNGETTVKQETGIKKVLMSELVILGTEEELMELENQEELTDNNSNINQEELKQDIIDNSNQDTKTNPPDVSTGLPTKVISENNKTDKFTDVYKSVKIKNESKYPLTEEMVTPNIDFSNKKDIIIYHTHTCESYTPTAENNYVASGNFRTTDLNYSVARVGTELTNNLSAFGFNVNHNTAYHDYPAYTGSYTRGLSTIQSILSNSPSTEFVIDLHRDALGSNSGYAPSVKIGEEVASQIMFVMGTDGGGLEHPNWLNNLKLAIKIQEKANEMYPGLFKPIILRDSRYNQHVSKGACIIEVGATGNTIEQCNTSMKFLANVINEVMNK